MITERQLGWVAGFIEGEGCFGFNCGSLCVKAAQVQREPLERLKGMFGGSIYPVRSKRPTSQPAWTWVVTGPKAVGVSMMLYALMSPRRREQIRKVLREWRSRPAALKFKVTCSRGHHLSGDNVYWNGRRRICRVCKVFRERAKRSGKKLTELDLRVASL